MRPRDLTKRNWDVNVAVFERPAFEARVTADGKQMWFRVSNSKCFADLFLPIKDFRYAADEIDKFDDKKLTPKDPNVIWKIGSYRVEICARFGVKKGRRWIQKPGPPVVLICPWREHVNHAIVLHLSEFRKLIRWYNSDLKI